MRNADAGSLHDDSGLPTATVCGFGRLCSVEPTKFTRSLLLVIRRTPLIYREGRKFTCRDRRTTEFRTWATLYHIGLTVPQTPKTHCSPEAILQRGKKSSLQDNERKLGTLTGLTLLTGTPCKWHPHWFHNQVDELLKTLVNTLLTEIPGNGRSHNLISRTIQLMTSLYNEDDTSSVFQLQLTNSDLKLRIDVAVEILHVHLQPIKYWEDTILLYKAHAALTLVSLLA